MNSDSLKRGGGQRCKFSCFQSINLELDNFLCTKRYFAKYLEQMPSLPSFSYTVCNSVISGKPTFNKYYTYRQKHALLISVRMNMNFVYLLDIDHKYTQNMYIYIFSIYFLRSIFYACIFPIHT